ncbi:hypothetical protein [Dietzia sp. SYD-A1]|uniref:hypothetical protein n=1 Tax=Dietzia sp. SYD-A1 TaxID=2780141 RepID=UPI0018919CAC|nr:hypothetical protein [Dietzia sp. SYD-A1]
MNAVLIVVILFYLGAMAELLAAIARSRDRRRVLLAALAVVFTLVAARALLPVTVVTVWGWVAAVTAYAAVGGLAFLRARQLPWIDPDASRRDLTGSAIWLVVLLALTTPTLRSLL